MQYKELEEKLNRAEVLLKGGNREQQNQARGWLNELMTVTQYPTIAREAHELFIKYPPLESIVPDDPKTRELRNQWARISSLAHAEVKSFLTNLFGLTNSKRVELARASLRHEVIAELKQWIKKETEETALQQDEQDWITERVKAVHEHPDFENVLNQELKAWQQALFNKKYQQQKNKIQAVLANWLIDKAWHLFNALPPTELQDEVATLKQEITEVDHDVRVLNRRLEQFKEIPPKPFQKGGMTWAEMRRLVEQKPALQQFQPQSHYPIPTDKQQQIQECLARFSAYVSTFLANEAQKCRDLQDIREFWKQCLKTDTFAPSDSIRQEETDTIAPSDSIRQEASSDSIRQEEASSDSFRQVPWFNDVVEAHKKENDNVIRLASTAEELDNIGLRLQNESECLPPSIEAGLKLRALAVFELAEIWRTVITGENFSILEKDLVAIPEAFQNDISRYQTIWEQLDNISQRLHPATDYPTAEDFQWATGQLTEILKNYPTHKRALRLQAEVAQSSQQHRFDVALQKWDIVGFLTDCQHTNPDGAVRHYLKLAEYEKELYQLNQLAKAEKFSNMSDAKAWWTTWKSAIQILSPKAAELPATFWDQVEAVEEQRRAEWFKLSETLLADTQATAADYHKAASTISICLDDPVAYFRQYYNEFTRKAYFKETEGYINANNWQAAQQSLAQFKQSGGTEEEGQRLTILLDIRQKQAENPSALANRLWDNWRYVHRYLAPEDISDLLYVAIKENWRNYADERLSKLETLASRLASEQMSEPLRWWIEWLEIEKQLEILPNAALPKGGINAIERLAKFVLAPNQGKVAAELRKPLERLAKSWQRVHKSSATRKILPFIWLYQSSEHIQPPLISDATDPLTQFTQQSEQSVAQIEANLKNATMLSETKLLTALDEVKSVLEQWQTLEDYFESLPYQTSHHPVKPALFNDVQNRIDKLLSVQRELVYLEEADIRQFNNKKKLEGSRYYLSTQLQHFGVQPDLLKRVEELLSLKDIHHEYKNFERAGFRCGSCASNDLDTPHLFEKMGNHLKAVMAVFEKANVVERGMWRYLSQECDDFVRQEAGVLVAPSATPDLRELLTLLQTLEEEESSFRNNIWEVGRAAPDVPTGGTLDCTRPLYQPFFNKFPSQAPRTRRGYCLFERVVKVEPCYTILLQCQEQVPGWVRDFLERGVPE